MACTFCLQVKSGCGQINFFLLFYKHWLLQYQSVMLTTVINIDFYFELSGDIRTYGTYLPESLSWFPLFVVSRENRRAQCSGGGMRSLTDKPTREAVQSHVALQVQMQSSALSGGAALRIASCSNY